MYNFPGFMLHVTGYILKFTVYFVDSGKTAVGSSEVYVGFLSISWAARTKRGGRAAGAG